jgi:hypothetical protein
MVVLKIFVLVIFSLAITSSTMVICTFGSQAMSNRLFGLSPTILVSVLLLMLIGYSNGCTRAHNLSIAAQTQIMEEPFVGNFRSTV